MLSKVVRLVMVAVVMEHTENLYNSIAHYFSVLEQVGSYKDSDVKKLLAYLFIVEEVFNGQLQQYLDDEGLRAFDNVLRCISNSTCFAVSPDRIKLQLPVHDSDADVFRLSETQSTRYTESDDIRTASSDSI